MFFAFFLCYMQRTTAAHILVWILAHCTVQTASFVASSEELALLTGDVCVSAEVHREIDIYNGLSVDILSYTAFKVCHYALLFHISIALSAE